MSGITIPFPEKLEIKDLEVTIFEEVFHASIATNFLLKL